MDNRLIEALTRQAKYPERYIFSFNGKSTPAILVNLIFLLSSYGRVNNAEQRKSLLGAVRTGLSELERRINERADKE